MITGTLCVLGGSPALHDALGAYGWRVSTRPGPDDVAVLAVGPADGEILMRPGVPVLALGAVDEMADAAGLVLGRVLPEHEVRVRPGRDAAELAARWGDPDLLVVASWPLVEKVADDVEQLLTASSAFVDHPIATWRPTTGVGLLTLACPVERYAEPALVRLLVRLLRHVTGQTDAAPVRIGMLGYGAIGHEHAVAIGAVQGLDLVAVCDPVPARIAAARQYAPALRGHDTGEALLEDEGVDLVIVSTPPNTHADWVLRALQAGKHVVVEKPFCLSTADADRQMETAQAAGRTLAVYQNRRWDPDFLALRAAVRAGRIGQLFHLETFVGGYGHPCNFWHSDAEISGGHLYDWGSHFLDQVLDLLPQPVEWVSASAHKRVWHDVTNADHTRVLLHYEDGVEAEFTDSDLAAARKPKFYALGTTGAIVGDWQQERIISRSPVGLVVEDRFAVADAPAALTLHTADGSTTSLAAPAAPPYPFHRELADALLMGAPMSVTPAGSRRAIAVMEAATESAASGGRPVVPAA